MKFYLWFHERGWYYICTACVVLAGVIALFGCSGIAQMSDRWCDAHPKAPHYRCAEHTS